MSIDDRKQKLAKLLKIDEKKRRILAIQQEMASPNFWQDRDRAEIISKEFSNLNDLVTIFEEAQAEESIAKLETQAMLSGPYDENSAILALHAGAGGTEAQDWAEMLLRMLERWTEKRHYSYQILEINPGEEAGIKSATLKIAGPYVFGWLKSEAGVHRLVRLSPFDADHARHTSFVLVEVFPEIHKAELVIKDSDLKIDVYGASGHGGQNVNKTETAVRITHIPTGIAVACQKERGQHQNKEIAMKILQSKLAMRQWEEKRKRELQLRGEHISAGWANQVRSYVLHPYKLVKDHRTGFESKDPESVLGGDLDGFMESYLRNQKLKTKT